MPDIGLLGGGPRPRAAVPARAAENTITAVTPVTAGALPVVAEPPAERAQPRVAAREFAELREGEGEGERGRGREEIRVVEQARAQAVPADAMPAEARFAEALPAQALHADALHAEALHADAVRVDAPRAEPSRGDASRESLRGDANAPTPVSIVIEPREVGELPARAVEVLPAEAVGADAADKAPDDPAAIIDDGVSNKVADAGAVEPVLDPTPVFAAQASEPAAPAPDAPKPDGHGGGESHANHGSLPPAPLPIHMSDLLWLALALLAIIGTGLGIRDPWPADEPRFAAVARDMVATGEWLFPRVGGDLYQDKPPVFFWLLSVCYLLTGSLKAAFLIPAFLAAGTVMFLVYDLGRRLVSRSAGLAAGVLVACTFQFVQTMRGAQIDPVLCALTTFSLYALLRHLLLGAGWGWYALGGFAAGIGIITKGVGFLPLLVLIPYFVMRARGWQGLATLDAGKGGWKWWLAPLAMLLATWLWFIPMMLAVEASGAAEYRAYRDEILFKQTAGRYAAAWHHVKAWYYFIVEVIPPLWLPWSALLVWLVPRFRRAWSARDARVWLPLCWVLLVLAFFSASPGKRGVYVLPALPALALASIGFLDELLTKKSVRVTSIVIAALAWLAALGLVVAALVGVKTSLPMDATLLLPFVLIAGALIAFALWRKPVAVFPAAVAALAIWFSYWLAPVMNGERSGSTFVHAMLGQVKPGEELALVAYKEQFLLYLDRPTVNFGHRRWLEGPQENFDAAAWLGEAPNRVALVPEKALKPCFPGAAQSVGESSDDQWFLVRSASDECMRKGDRSKAIRYPAH